MHSLPLWLLPLAPAMAALIAGLLALTRRAEPAAPVLTLAATAISGIIALAYSPNPGIASSGNLSADWLTLSPGFRIALGVHLDALAWVMVGVVCTVSLLVQYYSLG